MSNEVVSFRPTNDAKSALERLIQHYRREFPTINKADVLNRLLIEQAEQRLEQAQQPAPREKGKAK